METGFMNRIIGLVLALVVGGLLVGGLLIPSIEGMTATEKTFENEGIYYMINPTEPMHVEFTGGTSWVINDEPLDYTSIGATNIVVFDDSFIRNNGQIRGTVQTGWTDADVIIGNGTITGTANNGNVTVNYTYDTVYIATNDKSNWIMTKPTNTTYILDDSELIGMGLTGVKDASNVDHYITFYVNVNGLTANITTPTASVTVSDISVNATPVNGYEGLYVFTSVTFEATWTDSNGSATTNCTYNMVIAPSQVTAELTHHMDATQIAMFGVISILGIVALVVVAANGIRNKY